MRWPSISSQASTFVENGVPPKAAWIMVEPQSDAEAIGTRYLEPQHHIVIRLGMGTDGTVFQTDRYTVIKVFRRDDLYHRELAAYLRLLDHGVEQVCGHSVPMLLDFADSLRVIEMDYVTPPYLLDFAKTRLDERPDFSAEVEQQWIAEVEEMFGPNAKTVWIILHDLWDKYGIWYLDPKPANIAFGE